MTSGLELYEKNLHLEVIADVKGWSTHPELSKLLKKLQSIKDWQKFKDHYAEAIVARHLISHRCEIKIEVPTVNGRCADFQVLKGNNMFFVHIKRLNFGKEMQHDLNVSKRLDSLRKRGIGFIFYKSLTDQEMQHFYKEAKKFSKGARMGDTKVIISKTGEILGECDKAKDGQSTTAYSGKDGNDSDRFSSKISDAYNQFMPDAVNVILVTSAWQDYASVEDLQEAVDDFWFAGKHCCSNIIGWFKFDPRRNSTDFKLFFRENNERPPYILDVF